MEKSTYKIWTVIEKKTVHADGSETYEDIDMDYLGVAFSLGECDSVDECISRMDSLHQMYGHDYTTDKQVFILGFDLDEGIKQYESACEAEAFADDWVRIKANSLEIAKERYDECHELIKKEGYHHVGVLISDEGELELLPSSF